MRQTLRLVAAMAAVIALNANATSTSDSPSSYPSRPVRMVIPFSPGGATDIIARVLATALTRQTGQNFLVENRAGANGNIANEFVAKSAPDGYTLLINTSSIVLSPALYKKLNYDVLSDFEPVMLTSVVPLVLAVNPSVPVKTASQFVDYAHSQPGKLFYSSAGNGNVTHMALYMLLQKLDIQATHVPYKGSGPSVVATTAGEVQFSMEPLSVVLPMIKSNRLIALAVTTTKRVDALPDTPTVAEALAMQGFEAGAWQGILAPAKTPPTIIAKLNAEIGKALADPTVRNTLAEQGAQILGSTPNEYGAYLKAELDRWSIVVKSSGVTLE